MRSTRQRKELSLTDPQGHRNTQKPRYRVRDTGASARWSLQSRDLRDLRGLWPLLTLHDLKLDLVAFGERLEA